MKGVVFNKRVLNVSLIFFSAYLLVHLLYLFFIFFCASFIGIQKVTYYFSYVAYDLVEFKGWSRLKISILYGIPTLMMPILAGLFWIVKEKFSFGNSPKIKLFYLSSIIISLSFFITDFIIAPFKRQGISLVAEWFYFKKETILGTSFLFWILIPVIAWFCYKSFMKLANSRTYLRTKWSRVAFLTTNVVQPYIFAALVLTGLILFVPAYTSEYFLSLDLIRMLVVLLVLVFVVLFNFSKKYIGVKKNRELEEINLNFVILTLFVSATIYLVLFF